MLVVDDKVRMFLAEEPPDVSDAGCCSALRRSEASNDIVVGLGCYVCTCMFQVVF